MLESYKKNSLILGSIAIAIAVSLIPLFPSDSIKSTGYNDGSVLKGYFTLTQADQNGNVIRVIHTPNLVMNEGMECVSDLIFGSTSCTGEAFFKYLAVGTSATAVNANQTALVSESGTCSRVVDNTPVVDASTSGQRAVTLSSLFSGASCEGSGFQETGLFDASTSGNMLARSLISPAITLSSGDTLTIDYTITINNT